MIEELLIGISAYFAGGGTVVGWQLWRHRAHAKTGTEEWYARRHRDRVAELAKQAVRNRMARDRVAKRGD